MNVAPIAPEGSHRLGFVIGEGVVPDDLDRIGSMEIAEAYGRQFSRQARTWCCRPPAPRGA